MESSEIKKKAIKLGKLLSDELSRESEADMLCRWMAHYIAEQMVVIEHASAAEKAAAEERCFRTILSLWDHRASLPNGRRPFEEFDPIFRGLIELDPESRHSYYFRPPLPENEKRGHKPDSVQRLIDLIFGIDYTARALMRWALDEATRNALTERTKTFLEVTIPNSFKRDIELIGLLSPPVEEPRNIVHGPTGVVIKERLDKLEAFCELCARVRQSYQKQLGSSPPKRRLKRTPTTSRSSSKVKEP